MKVAHQIYEFLQEYNFFVKAFFIWSFVNISWNGSTLTMLHLIEGNHTQV